jgi:hypothetical protein
VPKPNKPGSTKSVKKSAKKPNHKSPDAAAKRADADAKIHSFLMKPEAKEGLRRERLVELSKLGAVEVKASLNRLIKTQKAHSKGRTIDVKYFPGPEQKMAKKANPKSLPTAVAATATAKPAPAKRSAR